MMGGRYATHVLAMWGTLAVPREARAMQAKPAVGQAPAAHLTAISHVMPSQRVTPARGRAAATARLTGGNPIISSAPHNATNLDASRCVADCGDYVVAHTIPAYTSMDEARALTFLYTSAQANPTATITVDVRDTSSTRTATVISLAIRDSSGTGVITSVRGYAESFFAYQHNTWRRLAVRIPTASLATGVYTFYVIAKSYYTNSTTASDTVAVQVLVVNERASAYGAGWRLAGLQRLYPRYDGTVVLVDGTGTVQYYGGPCWSAPCTYTSPAGEPSVLRKHAWADGTAYDRTYPDGRVVVYASDGYHWYEDDRFGNRTTYLYSGANLTIQDPAGRQSPVVVSGTGDSLITVTDYGGRVTRLNLNASRDLVRIDDAVGGVPFAGTYDASHQLTAWTDRRGWQWTPTWDCAAHSNGVQAPAVTVGGASVRPQVYVNDRDVQTTGCSTALNGASNGVGGSLSTPAPSSAPDSIRTVVTNARGYATKYA